MVKSERFQMTEIQLLEILERPSNPFLDHSFSAVESTEQFMFSRGFRLGKLVPSFRDAVIDASEAN